MTLYFQSCEYLDPEPGIVQSLIDLSNSSNTHVSSWSIVCLGSLFQSINRKLHSNADKVWKLCCQRIHDSEVSSAACYCLSMLLEFGHLVDTENHFEIEQLVAYFDSRTPQLSTGSIMLANSLTHLNVPAGLSKTLSRRLINWIFGSWKSELLLSGTKTVLFGSMETTVSMANCLLSLCGFPMVPSTASKLRGNATTFVPALFSELENKRAWNYLQMASSDEIHVTSQKRTTPIRPISNITAVVSECKNTLDDAIEVGKLSNVTLHLIISCLILDSVLSSNNHDTEIAKKITILWEKLRPQVLSVSLPEEKRAVIVDMAYMLTALSPTIKALPGIYTLLLETIKESPSERNDAIDLDFTVKQPRYYPHDLGSFQWSQERFLVSADIQFTLDTLYNASCDPIGNLSSASQSLDVAQYIRYLMKFDTPIVSNDDLREAMRLTGTIVLPSYQWQKSEIGLLATIQLLNVNCSQWVSLNDSNQLRRDADDIFQWLVRMVVDGQCKSLPVNIQMGQLLIKVISNSAPEDPIGLSSLESFMKILKSSTGTQFYELSYLYQDLFRAVPSMDHQIVYTMIYESLGDLDQLDHETTIFRAAHLTCIAKCGWSVSVPVYNLIELAKNSFLAEYVRHSVNELANYFNYVNSAAFFNHLCESVMYSWTYTGIRVSAFPFQVAGYTSEREFYISNLELICANIMAFAYEDHEEQLEYIAKSVEMDLETISRLCFHKAVAFGQVFENPELKISDVSSIMEKYLGHDEYRKQLEEQMIEVVAELLNMVDMTTVEEGLLGRFQSRMFGSHGASELPTPNNRILNSIILSETIDRLCSSCSFDKEGKLWTLPGFVLIARKILSYGSDSAAVDLCLSIRRCLLLMKLSGNQYKQGYPFELLIRGLAPLMQLEVPANEARQVLQIILEDGFDFLRALTDNDLLLNISFAIVTTKDSDMLKWMRGYLRDFEQSPGVLVLQKCIEFLVNEQVDYDMLFSDEDVISFVVDDFNSDARNFCLKILAEQLEKFPDKQKHLLQDSDLKYTVATELLSFEFGDATDGMKTWAGRLLGSVYISTSGCLKVDKKEFLDSNSDADLLKQPVKHRPLLGIVRLLRDLVLEGDFVKLGFIEKATRLLKSSINLEKVDLLSDLPEAFSEAMSLAPGTFFPKRLEIQELNGFRYNNSSFSKFLDQFASFLLVHTSLPSDLAILVTNIPGFSKRALPFLVHQALLESRTNCEDISSLFNHFLASRESHHKSIQKEFVEIFFHLRFHQLTKDTSSSNRALAINFIDAARAAESLGSNKMAMLLLELDWKYSKESVKRESERNMVLATTCTRIADPDVFFSVQVTSSLSSAIQILKKEKQNWATVSYESALYDDQLSSTSSHQAETSALSESLREVGLNGVAKMMSAGVQSSWRLNQWDLPEPNGYSKDDLIFKLFKRLQNDNRTNESVRVADGKAVFPPLYKEALENNDILGGDVLESLAIISEVEQIMSVRHPETIELILNTQRNKTKEWVANSKYVIAVGKT